MISVCLLLYNCSNAVKPYQPRSTYNKINQNYNPYSQELYNQNMRSKNSINKNYKANSRLYENPYYFYNQYQQNQIYDYDQYYVAPTQYNNIEPEKKSVINNKY